jgi:hypothetical protein
MIAGFTAAERDYIRRELDQFFSALPTVAEGFQIKTWRGGPQAGQPKLPLPAKGLVERGLMQIDTTGHWPTAVLHRSRSGGPAHDDARDPSRRSGEVRPCAPGTRPRTDP